MPEPVKTDKQIYTLLGADRTFLSILTDGITVCGGYRFEAIEVKGLERRCDGVLLPHDPDETIWVVEFQAQKEHAIYHRTIIEMGLIGERNLGRVVRGLILFASREIDPETEPWCTAAKQSNPPLRVTYLEEILERLEASDPNHPLLAVFLPYRISTRDHLRQAGPAALTRLQQATLPQQVRSHCLDVFWSWLMVRFDDLTLLEIMRMFGQLKPLEETRAYKEIREIGHREGVDEGRRVGLDEGRRVGLDEGRRSEARHLVQILLARRFRALPAELEAQIDTLPVTALENLAGDILEFSTVGDLSAWLTRYGTD